jgi:hypothetical protein
MRGLMMVAVLMLTPLAQAAEIKLTNPALQASADRLEKELVAKYGDQARARLQRGLAQAGSLWRAEDGDAAAFESFVRENFAGDQKTHDALFTRLEYLFEQLEGHLLEINREFRMQADVEKGDILPADEILAAYDPTAHVNDDFFKNKLAFVVLLNFPLTTLEERIGDGRNWSRRQWAEARLAQRFARRIPAQVNLEISEATSAADRYISAYNIWMHHLLDEKGQRLFPQKLRLISHWNLRDELKGNYSEKNGITKQRMIQQVMERIVTQTIPESVVDNPTVDWKPFSNTVTASNVKDYETAPADAKPASNSPEPNTRYAMLLNNFKALRKADPYSPTAPTAIERSFEDVREIPEARVKAMFEKVLTSPMVPQVAKLIEKRLGRKLEPFDIWYSGFRARGQYTEAQLDEITRKKYPTAEAYRDDMKNLFVKLGFTPERAAYLMEKIEVHPSRGAGHAFGAAMKGEKAYLRTRVESGGMDYKGYNIAVHEMGHNVEQTFSLYDVDHWFLQGVPNTAFTEALAFVFQNKDLELLGLSKPDEQTRALKVLDDFWGTYEIAGVALVDVAVWHWMYEHPDATPAQLRDATVQIAKDTWNRYYAPVFGKRDVVLLGVYSHMIDNPIYLPNYPIGHLIALQIEEHMEKEGKIGPEFERMARIGSIAPDIWMEKATGAPVGPDALLHATERALKTVK